EFRFCSKYNAWSQSRSSQTPTRRQFAGDAKKFGAMSDSVMSILIYSRVFAGFFRPLFRTRGLFVNSLAGLVEPAKSCAAPVAQRCAILRVRTGKQLNCGGKLWRRATSLIW